MPFAIVKPASRLSHLWELFLSRKLSLKSQVFFCLVVAVIDLALTSVLIQRVGTYFTSLTFASVILISLIVEMRVSIIAAIILVTAHDMLFQPPYAVFNTEKSLAHFGIACTIALAGAFLITSLRSAFRDMTIAKQEAKQATSLMEQMLSLVSHDVRNPLSAIKMNANLLNKHPERHEVLVDRVMKSLNRVDGMMRTLLDVSRLRAGKAIPLDFKTCDLAHELRPIIEDLKRLYPDRIVAHIDQTVLGNWSVDGIQRSLENLVANAFKYGAPESPIVVNLSRQQNHVVLSVVNYGNVISPKEIDKLFDPYFRARLDARSGNGWGLGLSLVKGVTEAHGGTVAVHSNAIQGTQFSMVLPLVQEPPGP